MPEPYKMKWYKHVGFFLSFFLFFSMTYKKIQSEDQIIHLCLLDIMSKYNLTRYRNKNACILRYIDYRE